jgi:methionyl-tRNA formyltransferase
VLVVTQPDRLGGRGMQMQVSPVKRAALECGLEVASPEKSRSPEFVEQLRSIRADALLVAAYGQILSTAVLESATRGGINLHGSILPRYRGAAPIQRAILNGESETGVTLMQMDRGMDTGNIIDVQRTSIDPNETALALTERLASLSARMAAEWMPRICAGEYPRTPQDDAQATVAPKVEKSEAELRCHRLARSEYNRFRAFTPSPGAFIRTRFGLVKISACRLGTQTGEPGVVLSTSLSCEVAFLGGSLLLQELQPEGKKRMTGKDFANGLRLRAGDSLV